MTCNVTGTAISPNGQIKPGAKITFRRAQSDVVSQEGSFVIPDDYIIQTALDGTVDFDILPGVYDATTVAVGGRTVAFRVSVPDEPAADFADLLNASYVEIPPASVTQAQQARDAAIDARDVAVAARDEALLYDGPKVDTFAELASVTPTQLAVGEYIRVIATGAVYQRVSTGGDLDYSGAGGVRLNVIPSNGVIAAPSVWPSQAGNRADWIQSIAAASRDVSANWRGRVIDVPAGIYEVNNTIRIPPFLRVRSNGSVEVRPTSDFPSGAPVFQVSWPETDDGTASPAGYAQNPFNSGTVLDGSGGVFLVRDPLERGDFEAFRFGLNSLAVSDNRRHLAWTDFNGLSVQDMGKGFVFTNKQTYIMRFYNCMASHCGIIIDDLGAPNINSGEQINWFGCGWHNSDLILRVRSQINHTFYGCSWDFSAAGVRIEADYCQVRLIGGWVEKSNTRSASPATSLETCADVPFILSTLSNETDGRQAHVTIRDTHFFPRDRLPAQMIRGHMALNFDGNQVHVDRFTTPNTRDSRRAEGLFVADNNVQILSFSGNSNLEQAMLPNPAVARNRNAFFAEGSVGTVANVSTPATIPGWTVDGTNAAQATFTIIDSDGFVGGRCLQVTPGTGNYAGINSDSFPVDVTDRLLGDLILKIPSGMTAINVTLRIEYFNAAGALLRTDTTTSDETTIQGNNLSWITTRNGMGNTPRVPPAGAHTARLRVAIGNMAGNTVKFGGALVAGV